MWWQVSHCSYVAIFCQKAHSVQHQPFLVLASLNLLFEWHAGVQMIASSNTVFSQKREVILHPNNLSCEGQSPCTGHLVTGVQLTWPGQFTGQNICQLVNLGKANSQEELLEFSISCYQEEWQEAHLHSALLFLSYQQMEQYRAVLDKVSIPAVSAEQEQHKGIGIADLISIVCKY